MTKLEARAQEEFEHFLFEMDDVLEDLVGDARARGFDLDFSLGSLDVFESYLSLLKKEGQPRDFLRTRGGRYLGEVFRETFGGKWALCLKSPRYLYYGLPVLAGYSDLDIEFCPSEVADSFLHDERPGLLRSAVEAHREYARGV